MRLLYSITDSMDMNLSKLWETVKDWKPGVVQSMGSQNVGHDLVTEQQLIHLTFLAKCVIGKINMYGIIFFRYLL